MQVNSVFKYKDKHKIQNIAITIFGAFLYSVGISVFIIPAGLYTGGFTGIAQLISDFSNHLWGVKLPVSWLWLVLNIPVFYIGYKFVGRRFTSLSIVSVLFGAIVLQFVAVVPFTSGQEIDKMLYAIMGGVNND